MQSIIRISKLTKKYGEFVAVNNITFDIKEGEIFGLLGPNGAGKTTTISMLSTINEPTSGSAKVNGHDIVKDKDRVRASIGIVFQDQSLDDQLTGRENLDLHGRLYGVPPDERKRAIIRSLKIVELEDKQNNLVKTYSGGMRRRLEIARGLIHKPKVLFLDEPTVGLDPQTRRRLWSYIMDLNKKEDMTIILTTHYIEEAEFLCDRVGIIDNGEVIKIGTPDELKDSLGGDIITAVVSNQKAFEKIANENPEVKNVKGYDKGKVDIATKNGSKLIPELINIAHQNRIDVESIMLKRPSLEDVFISLTGKEIREESGDNTTTMRMRFRGR
ncbi:MAG: ATP-binding cassette domain-containing protein [Candidatus Marsarchaeota archaeon]|nr:ATP-binding cassette domain-containing protein [Candidatus Marsarchaeota archaeon]